MKKFVNILKLFASINIVFTIILLIFTYPNFNLDTFNKALCSFDCDWYVNISRLGYTFKETEQSNTAFFPLFPLLLNFFSNNLVLASIFNQIIFAISFVFISDAFKINSKKKLVYLSTGLVLFFMIPYSESLFFLGSSLLLYGLHNKKITPLILGIFIACFSRSASLVFSIAFILLIIESVYNQRKELIKIYALSFLVVMISTFTVLYIHYLQTNDFYSYFKAQEGWEHKLSIPQLPFHSWGWQSMITDMTALIIGIVSVILVVQKFISHYYKSISYDGVYLFSLLYLSGITFSIILFQGGDLHSINRYIFSSAFFLIFINNTSNFKPQKFYFFPSIVALSLIFINRFEYIEHYIFYILLVFIYLKTIFSTEKLDKWQYIGISLLFLFQVSLILNYFNKNWVG